MIRRELLSTSDLEKRSDLPTRSLVAIAESDLQQIQKLLLDRVIKPWVKDDVSKVCHNCHTQFTFVNRKQ